MARYRVGPTKRTPIPKDATVVCPECGKDLYTTTKAIKSGDLISASQFKGISPVTDPLPREKTRCPYCQKDMFCVVGEKEKRRIKYMIKYAKAEKKTKR